MESLEGELSPEALVAELRTRSQSDRESFAALQQELKRVARTKMNCERVGHTLQPTALINEVFLKLFKGSIPLDFWTDQTRAIRYIVRAMSQILNDHADAYNSGKRGGVGKVRVPVDEHQAHEFAVEKPLGRLDPGLLVQPGQSEEIVAVREALLLLRDSSPRQAQVVELLFYGGLTQEEVAATLSCSVETIKLDWRKAKAFLKVNLEIEER